MTRNDGSFDAMVIAEWASLVRAMTLICGDVATAEDVVQEAFARAAVRWSRVSSLDSPRGWVHHVALNLARSRWRRRRIELGAASRHRYREAVDDPSEDAVRRHAVVSALMQLPFADREALVLRHLVGLPHAEISRLTGTSEDAVRARVSRAGKRVRPLLEEGVR